MRFGLATATTVLLSYLMVFIEGTNVVDISRLLQRLRTPGRRGVFQEFPRWLLTTLAAWLLGIGLVILIAVNDNNAWVLRDTNLYSLVLASLLFLMRDLAIVLYARFADKKNAPPWPPWPIWPSSTTCCRGCCTWLACMGSSICSCPTANRRGCSVFCRRCCRPGLCGCWWCGAGYARRRPCQ